MVGWLLRALNCNNEKIAVESNWKRVSNVFRARCRMLLDVECAMNNRPLCYQGEDFENEVKTPNILLRGRPARMLEDDLQNLNEEDNVTKRLKYVKRYKEELRKQWMQELYALKER